MTVGGGNPFPLILNLLQDGIPAPFLPSFPRKRESRPGLPYIPPAAPAVIPA